MDGPPMKPIRTLVADDEPESREGILAALRSDPEILICGECGDGLEAVAAIERNSPDLVFLDVQMPGLDGFNVIRRVGPERMPVVVFVTAFDLYALRAFEAHALDFLLKPFSDERFADALRQAKGRVRRDRISTLGEQLAALIESGADRHRTSAPAMVPNGIEPLAARRFLERVMIRTAGRVSPIRVDDIDWIEADDYYAKVHVAGRSHLIRETMDALEAKLDPSRFVRVHRSAIVNVDRIQSVQPYFRQQHVIVLRDGTKLTLSRRRRAALERVLGPIL
jgi:two-component system, LytTR family, response regulator